MPTKTKDDDKQETMDLAPVEEPNSPINMIIRMASDEHVDVEKLEKLIAMQERIMAHEAKAAYTRAFVSMQGELPDVQKLGDAHYGKYARMEDIQRTLRPVLKEHGFVLSFSTETMIDGDKSALKVTARLSHQEGHSEETSLTAPADNTGGKNGIQAIASTESYLMRYTTLALLNITTTAMDDDGEGYSQPDPPDGYDKWCADMAAIADEGSTALGKAWKDSDKKFKAYIAKWEPQVKDGWKATASEVQE